MNRYAALLRAVNVGGTGKLEMGLLRQMCEEAGFGHAKTYIASGNVVFTSGLPEAKVKAVLETALEAYAGKPVGVLVRTAADLESVLARNPFADKPGNHTVALFVNGPLPIHALDEAKGRDDEEMRLGQREIFIFYPSGQGRSKLAIPAAKAGTARNMNTVAKLAEMAKALP
jgi:uncharacterized protein (DUF1697 family)